MAAFLNADRWSSGVTTHKTREGRILCTGAGCIGCFPETNMSEADELGICSTGHPFRTFLNEEPENNRRVTRTGVAKHTGKPRKKDVHPKKKKQDGDLTESTFDSSDVNLENRGSISKELQEIGPEVRQRGVYKHQMCSVGTQTLRISVEINRDPDPSSLQLSEKAQRIIHSLRGPSAIRNRTGKPMCLLEECKLDQTIEDKSSSSISQQQVHNNASIDRKVHRAGKIHDSLYLVSDKDMALNFHENILPRSREDQKWNGSPWDFGEDAVCFYFAIEYYGSPRVLPRFKVLEIVEALSEVAVDVRDIKCVQRVGVWQIVLRTRKYLSYLRAFGIKLRGRVYKLVEDVESYCSVVYGCV